MQQAHRPYQSVFAAAQLTAPARSLRWVQQGDLISPRGSLDAGTSGFNSRRQTYDLESPLIEQPTAEAAEAEQLRAAARAAEADLFNGGSGDAGAGDPVHDGDRRPSLSSPVYSEHRDSRTLWRLARRNLGAWPDFVLLLCPLHNFMFCCCAACKCCRATCSD